MSRARKPREVYGVDSEDDSAGNPYLFALVGEKLSWTGETRQSVLDRIRDLGIAARAKGSVVELWATNLEYDLVNLFGPERIREVQLRFGKTALVGASWRGHNVDFRDTVRHIPASVAELGELVGLKKINLAMKPEQMRARCIRDAAITYRTAKRIAEVYAGFGEYPRLTLPSTAYHVWHTRYFKSDVFLPCEEVRVAARHAYHGGRTEAFSLGTYPGVRVIDVASMYPWALTAGPMGVPWGAFQRVQAGEPLSPCGLFDVRVSVPGNVLPPLPYRTEDGTIYPCGTWRGWYLGEELQYAESIGVQVQVLGGFNFLAHVSPFSEYVAALFALKSKARGVMRTVYKLMLNGTYGKFGQGGDRVLCIPQEQLLTMANPPQDFRLWNGLAFYRQHSLPPPWGNNLWAAVTTARARIRLHAEMARLRRLGCRVLYCDTDSVVYLGRGPRYPEKAKRAGLFESRGEFREIVIVGKKEYGLRSGPRKWELHAKGVPARERKRYLREGVAEFQRPVKMRESSRINLAANVWRTVRKERRTVNRGRELLPDGSLRVVTIRE